MCNIYRPVTSLGHQGRRRVFWEGPNFFKLCPIVLTYAQHIFPGRAKSMGRGVHGYGPEHLFEEQSTEGQFKR